MTFHPHPLAVLAPERAPAMLHTLTEKLALLDRAGVAVCIVQPSAPGFLSQRAEDFLASLVAHCRPRALVEGPDFNFGRGRAGNVTTLAEKAPHWGYELHVVPAVRCEELPTHPTVSSSSIRQSLRDGRIVEARAMLGRPHRIVGTTGRGASRGAGLGFPTANLEQIQHVLPQYAVYAAIAQLPSGGLHLAAVNIGPQPTFSDQQARVEAHLLDFDGDLHERRIGLHFLARLREQIAFRSVSELIEQLHRDVATTRGFTGEVDELLRQRPMPL
jgi:riboflavin kinase/FMN adenylyltransferase